MAKLLEYDGVVIGAGHNGMICAAYLAKCSQKIMVVEKNMEVGGGLDSHEDRNYPGFWHNIHSVFHRGLMMLPWFKDLELENFGIHYYRPDPGVVHHFLDKTYLGWFALIAHGGSRHDDVPDGDVRVEHPGATAGDDLRGSQRDDFLQQAGGKWGANAGMKDGQPLTLDVELVEGVRPKLTPHMVDDRGFLLLG